MCEDCPNVKFVREPDTLMVSVEPGMPDRHTITFFEEGEPILDGGWAGCEAARFRAVLGGRGCHCHTITAATPSPCQPARYSLPLLLWAAGEHGDLQVVIRTLPHPLFERRGIGLLCNVTISLLDALVGFEREVGGEGDGWWWVGEARRIVSTFLHRSATFQNPTLNSPPPTPHPVGAPG